MKRLHRFCMLIAIIVIGCQDPDDNVHVDQSNKKKEAEFSGFFYDGTYHSIPQNSTIDDELKKGTFTIARSLIMSGDPPTLNFFSTAEKFETFAKSKYSAAGLEAIQGLEKERDESTPEHVRKDSNLPNARTQGYEWEDFNIQHYKYSTNQLAETRPYTPQSFLMDFENPNHISFIPDEIDYKTPARGRIFSMIHANNEGGNCRNPFACYQATVVVVEPEDVVTVNNRVYGTFGSTNGRSMRWALERIPHDELFILKDGVISTVNRSTGAGTTFLTGKSNVTFMASVKDYLYTIDNGVLTRVNPYNGNETQLDAGWNGTEAFTAGKVGSTPHIFGVQGDHLWKTNLSNMVSTSFGPGWGGTAAMTYGGGYIYAVHGDNLWKVNASNGSTTSIDYGWTGVEALTFYNGNIYGVQGGVLWKVTPNGVSSSLGANWGNTDALTSYGASLYGIQGGYLWETSPVNGSTSAGMGSWEPTVAMTAVFQ